MKKKLITVFLISTMLSGCGENKEIKTHIHTFDSDWLANSEGHFRKCIYDGCQATSTVSPHHYDEEGICTTCGFNIDDDYYNDSCAHDWSLWEIDEEPNCIEKGSRSRYCKKCGKEQVRSIPVDTTAHLWMDDLSADRQATCTASGIEGSKYCFRCYAKKSGQEVPLLAHSYEVKDHVLSKEPTCTEPGLRYVECTVCHVTNFEELPALGHELIGDDPIYPGYTDAKDEFCERCHKRFISWKANDVTDNCKNNKRLIKDDEGYYPGGYEPNYEEFEDGGVSFYGRPIHNALYVSNEHSGVGGHSPELDKPRFDATIEGSFFEYKLYIDGDLQNAKLFADIRIASYSETVFAAEERSWLPGLIDSVDNPYKTRYVVTLDGNELEQDLTKDVQFDNPTTDMPRDWFAFPFKDGLNLSSGEHILRFGMGSGYKSVFYNFRLETN